MPTNPVKSTVVLWFAVQVFAIFGLATAGVTPVQARDGAASALTLDEGGQPYDRGTEDGDDNDTQPPGNQTPSEDDTQLEARPQAPDFGGCIFEKRDLGLLV